ncbi:MAG: type IV secretion system DNA-binding domain-containing protein, partial [Candidatus Azambacteria bacterium]|nr:type IV secretion system DNA-binding domain-containing protein [Candidatus Azambacteria bacterium]
MYPNSTNKDEITFFAETNFRNQRKRFGIKIDDRRRHMYIIGQTGTGKTTLLMNMLVSDIAAGRGVGFIDPHGDMAEHLLNYIPKERIEDVIYFNPADMAYPIAFNAIEKVEPEVKHLVASGLMGVFKKIWPDVWSARMEYILNNTVL